VINRDEYVGSIVENTIYVRIQHIRIPFPYSQAADENDDTDRAVVPSVVDRRPSN
jgi:hypothetical protein